MPMSFEELFAPTLNGIAVSVWLRGVECHNFRKHSQSPLTGVQYMCLLLQSIWVERLALDPPSPVTVDANKQDNKKRKKPSTVTLFRSETQTLNSSRSLDYYARFNKPRYYVCFNDLYKPIKKYIYADPKHPFTCFPAAKHYILWVTNTREKPVNSFYGTKRALSVALAIILLA